MIYDALIAPFTEFEFMRRALAAVIALALGGAPIGVFLMLRRMSLVGDAMAHAILPGAAIGFLALGAAVAYNPRAGIGLVHGMLPVVRDLLGFTGVALLLSLAIGGLLSWIGPLAYVGICQCAAIANYSEPLTWAARPPTDRGGWIAALVVFAAGLAAFTIRGPRIRPSGE